MERAGGERPVAVDNEAGVVVIGDGNRVGFGTGATVRSAYREQVRRIAPPELIGREDELAELAAFCRTGDGYRWWRADAWAGKTALMAWFALNPPTGVRIVPFFITARLGSQNDVVAYVDVVLEQLAELAGEGIPAHLTAATKEAHLFRLYGEAARTCAARGERLVLLVDGLDEDRGVTTGPEARSIASLLPASGHVVVSGRLNPPLPADVRPDHPLRNPEAVRILPPSPRARAIRAEAERELKHLLAAGGLPYELLGLVTVSGGGLTADDLAELTGDVPYRVRDLLRTGPGRTFALRGEGYLLAHEELVVQAREMLGPREQERWRGILRGWAEGRRARGWPADTPAYLLHGWFTMLRAAGDPDGMVDCALDAVRHDRLLAATGGDGAALAEIEAAGETVLAGGDRPALLTALLRLALRRAALRDRNGQVPADLPVAWAELGERDRALALARGLAPPNRIRALCALAELLHADGLRERAHALLDEADALARAEHQSQERPFALWAVGDSWLAVGAAGRAEEVMNALSGAILRRRPLLALVAFRCGAGEFRRALGAVREVREDRTRALGHAIVCGALAASSREPEALALARSEQGFGKVLGLLRIAAALGADAPQPLRASTPLDTLDPQAPIRPDRLVREALAVVEEEAPAGGSELAAELITALVAAGAVEQAEALAVEPGTSRHGEAMRLALVKALAQQGDPDRAEGLLALLAAESSRSHARAALVEAWAEEDAVDRLRPVLAALTDRFSRPRAVRAAIGALVRTGYVEEAEALASSEPDVTDPQGSGLKVCLVRALTAAGHRERAAELLSRVEEVSRAPRHEDVAPVLAAVAEALALAGHLAPARLLTDGLEAGTDREPQLLRVVRALLATGRFEEAERQSREARVNQRDYLVGLIARAREADGPDELLREFGRPTARRGCVRLSGDGVPRPRLPAPETGVPVAEVEGRAARARALHGEGRDDDAALELDRAVAAARGTLRYTAVPLAAVVRAQTVLGRREEAAELLAEAVSYLRPADGRREVSFVAQACVAAGRHDDAESLVAEATVELTEETAALRLDLAEVWARAGEHGRAEALLDGLARVGLARAGAYAVLALTHPDPVRAREITALALHVGPWYEALPAVLRHEPDAVPLVLAEADRLRRALEV
ncbi:hypothetical protein ABZY16_14360 [Streptomyces sp. NPDC006553]|uniref:hypothetical protein n=1 Tax=unclassified Streptomyces TaxID=2593676 RepID=UPI0022524659|nr:hypothetical protein [Streptomyces sp. NBC_00233]MCX5228122.1 hypothetical protein [Streptomyces sp. NBC_00233]